MINIRTDKVNESTSEYILIWLLGQSNIGRGGLVFPSYITTGVVMTDVEFWNVHTETWEDVIPGTNGAPLGTNASYGFTHELAYRLKLKYPNKKIRFFLGARGGATLGRRAIKSFFHTGAYPDQLAISPANHENWWYRIKNQYVTALAGMSYIDFGALWIQGESNAIEGFPAVVTPYKIWEKCFVREFQDLTGKKNFICINIHPDIINNDLFDGNPEYTTSVRNAKIDNNSEGLFTHYRDSADIELRSDSLHFDMTGIQTISQWLMDNIYASIN